MGRQKKKEIDSVLEQLKKSYVMNADDDLEDSLLESEKSEDDAELTSILEKIFSSNEDSENNEAIGLFENEEGSDFKIENETETAAETKDNSVSQSKFDDVEENQSIKTEEEKVEDIFKIMFGSSDQHNINSIEDACDENVISGENIDNTNSQVQKEQLHIESNITENKTYDATHDEDGILQQEYQLSAYIEPIVLTEISDNGFISDEEKTDDFICDCNIGFEKESTEQPELKEYVFDPLQETIEKLRFFKPENDIDLSFGTMDDLSDYNDENVNTRNDGIDNEITDKDISLLMKFGYDGEISASGESIHANDVIFDNSKKYIPEKHKILHGFTGNEFSSNAQIPEIKKKFKIDRFHLLIRAIIVSVISLFVASLNIVSMIFDVDKNIQMFLNVILPVIVLVILFKKIWSGVISLLRFEPNKYSLSSILLIEDILFLCVINVACYYLPNEIPLISFSGYALIYVSFTVWSEYINCVVEMDTFKFITDSEIQYVAEKRSYASIRSSEEKFSSLYTRKETNDKYIIRQAKFVSGFHHKIAESRSEHINTVVIIGILPIVAILLSFAGFFAKQNVILGINIASYILFLYVPVSSEFILSFIDFLIFRRLKKNNSVCIGSDSLVEISNAESLIFEDIDVLEITSCMEINPESNKEKTRKWFNIARGAFAALGGPLANALQISDDQNISHDVAINSISDNGIDIYFDSSVNILIGDRQYMLSHNIKVKTDINLTGAIKGAERTVIYLAFERVPQIGFIVGSKVKDSFIETIDLLKKNHINVEVKSYEPQINEIYFELNDIECPIPVIKPQKFEHFDQTAVSNSIIVSSSPLELCKSIVFSKKASKEYLLYKKIKKVQSIIGCISAVFLAIIFFMPLNVLSPFEDLKQIIPFIFYGISFLLVIPSLIQIIKIILRKQE